MNGLDIAHTFTNLEPNSPRSKYIWGWVKTLKTQICHVLAKISHPTFQVAILTQTSFESINTPVQSWCSPHGARRCVGAAVGSKQRAETWSCWVSAASRGASARACRRNCVNCADEEITFQNLKSDVGCRI